MRPKMQLVAAIILLLFLAAQGTVLAAPDLIRLHIIANSDSPRDQQVKELVRDRIVVRLGPVFAELDQEEVAAWIIENKSVVAGIAQEVLEEAGCGYSVGVKFGIADYPTRLYGMAAYPAGKYKSLRIELGKGEGRNWWCVMFPPLCFVREAAKPEAEPQEEVIVRCWLWEKILAIFKGIGGKKS